MIVLGVVLCFYGCDVWGLLSIYNFFGDLGKFVLLVVILLFVILMLWCYVLWIVVGLGCVVVVVIVLWFFVVLCGVVVKMIVKV